jgi:ABC-type bacteriocin/lantibiotic exporter with double-glycine peptidase domain
MIQVGNYIHNMATFFSGLVLGFINCWQIALITLATGPFIVAAGGISNIFLHRLAENIQDAYAEAASIAEQVYFCCFIHLTYLPPTYQKRKKQKKGNTKEIYR